MDKPSTPLMYADSFREGEFVRPDTDFRSWVRRSGTEGEPNPRYRPEAGRYHLYVSLACPWSHRVVLVRKLKGLEDVISMSVTNPVWNEKGWTFEGTFPGILPDEVNHQRDVIGLYRLVDPKFSAEETVPLLWDKKTGTIVNNESTDLMRMLDREFREFSKSGWELCPAGMEDEVDQAIREMYGPICNGVYQSGFARSQKAYERAVIRLFEGLESWEVKLGSRNFVCGNVLTEADLALYVALVRFDAVYYSHFKCNWKRILDFPHLSRWLKRIYEIPGVSETTRLDHIKHHYYGSHKELNPTGIIPHGPERIFP